MAVSFFHVEKVKEVQLALPSSKQSFIMSEPLLGKLQAYSGTFKLAALDEYRS